MAPKKKIEIEEVVTPEAPTAPAPSNVHPEYDPSIPENKQRHTR